MEVLNTFELAEPITVDGAKVSKIELKRFKAKDLIHVSSNLTWGDMLIILENSSNLLRGEIDQLSNEDAQEIGLYIFNLMVPDDLDGTTVKLQYPIKNSKGAEITEISMAKPRAKHLRNMPIMAKLGDQLRMAAELSQISFKTLLELDGKDAINVVHSLGK